METLASVDYLVALAIELPLIWASLVAQMVESACNAVDLGSISVAGRSPEKGNGSLLQYSCLGNAMDRGSW